jgi:GWxTD domain-containing protein
VRWFLRGAAAAVALAGVYSPPIRSQAVAPRSGFSELRDSLSTVSDSAALRQLLEHTGRSDLLRRGLIALRLGELRADPDFGQALSIFQDASKQAGDHPETWYGLGLADAARSEWEMRDRLRLGSRVGIGALERAAADNGRALVADPRFLPAALALARIELTLLDTTRLKRARDVLRRTVAASFPASPELLLAWGRVERSAGTLDSAEIAFERYLMTGGRRALGLLELARTRLALGRPDGDEPYYEGAALDDPEAEAGYRADLALIAPDSILREFDGLQGQSRAAYLHRFWTDRDHLELRREGERLKEHYRRVVFARANFPLTISRRFYGRFDAYRSGSTELDDRGVIYVRQGAPTQRLRPFVFGAMPNESWRYQRGDGDLLFHFSSGYDGYGGGDLYDYRLVESVFDLHGAADAPRDQLILSRQSLSPMYSRMLNWGRYGAANQQAQERDIGATSIAIGTTTDRYELTFAHRLLALADLLAIGRTGDRTRGHLVFGIPAAGVTPRVVPGGVEYQVRVRVVALDRYNRAVATQDTTITVWHHQVLSKDEFIVGRAEIPLPPGHWSYRAALQLGDSTGVVLPTDSVLVATSDPRVLSLSDIALGTPGRSVPWINDGGDSVFMAPSQLFRRGLDVGLYYEVSGTVAGQQYRHHITVLRPGDRPEQSAQHPLVSLSFDEAATGDVIHSRRVVRMDQLKPGNYVVEVTVAGPDGRAQSRRRALRLLDR